MPGNRDNRGAFRPLLLMVVALTAGACSHGGSSERPAAQSTSTASAPSAPRPIDWNALDEALGRKGDVMAGDVHRYGFPRSDLKVTLDGIALKPGFALGSYAAFAATGTGAVVMGDLVLTEAEVSPVMAKLQEQGLEVSALHNHLLREQPKIMYLHYAGRSEDAVALGRSLRASLAASATPMTAPAASAGSPDLGFDPAALDQTLGHTGTTSGGLHKYAIARAETVVMSGGNGSAGVPLTPALGVGTVINFQPLGAGKAAITGDFALIGSEVAKVAQTLRANGIEVTAAHTHMTDDTPHLYYMHFFASGPATDLAGALRAALNATNSAKG
jgi:biotin operon repressor